MFYVTGRKLMFKFMEYDLNIVGLCNIEENFSGARRGKPSCMEHMELCLYEKYMMQYISLNMIWFTFSRSDFRIRRASYVDLLDKFRCLV